MSLIVEVNQGKLQGKEKKSVLTGKPYYSFQGIPYAKPPLGELRFQAPVPSEKWKGIYDATYERDICIQSDFDTLSKTVGSEDCLYLNVNTPQLPADIKILKSVMIYIHGGAFSFGSGSEKTCSPDYLIRHDVVVVTLNYRLHVLGIPGCPGNFGLKDQRLALKWVKENIIHFGGDPENITIFGESAGAASVQHHTISPLSKGLFQKGILQCGSACVPWALTTNPYEIAFKLGTKLGFKGEDKEKLLDFLKQQTALDLLKKRIEIVEELNKDFCGLKHCPFHPSIEAIKNEAFLPDFPQKLMKTADPLPIIHGANDKEGMLMFLLSSKKFWELISKDFSILLREEFNAEPKSSILQIAQQIKQHYFDNNKIGIETAEEITNLYTDIFLYHFSGSIENVMKASFPVYVYQFAYDGSFNTVKQKVEKLIGKSMKGACHADELGYLFYSNEIGQFSPTENDLKVINSLTTMWTNFAKTGNPSNELNWKPSTPAEPSFLRIDVEPKLIEGTLHGERLQVLKTLLDPYLKAKVV